jgi:hypothetical protein
MARGTRSGSTKRGGAPIEIASTPRRARRRTPMAPTQKKRSRVAVDQPTTKNPTNENIRVRAYYLYLQRDERSNDPLNDWLRAEQELKASTIERPRPSLVLDAWSIGKRKQRRTK